MAANVKSEFNFVFVFALLMGICLVLFLSQTMDGSKGSVQTTIPVPEEPSVKIVETNYMQSFEFRPGNESEFGWDVNRIVYFSAELVQSSTNFVNYHFAREDVTYGIEGLSIKFLNDEGSEVMDVPCKVRGYDIVWPMDGTRSVLVDGCFILTSSRLHTLRRSLPTSIYLEDNFHVLRGNKKSGPPAVYRLKDSDRFFDRDISGQEEEGAE